MTNKSIKVAGYIVDMQNLVVFLHLIMKLFRKEPKESPGHAHLKNTPKNYSNQRDIYCENLKTMKEKNQRRY